MHMIKFNDIWEQKLFPLLIVRGWKCRRGGEDIMGVKISSPGTLWIANLFAMQDGHSPGRWYQNKAMGYRNIESISVLKVLFTRRRSRMGWTQWCSLILMKKYVYTLSLETSLKMNILVLVSNHVIHETEKGLLAH